MNKLIPFFILILTSCAVPKPVVTNTSFSTIYKSTNGGTENAGYLHITNNEDYIKLIETLKIDESEFNKLVVVNFKENDVIVLYQGQKTSGGFEIDVEKITWENKILLVTKTEIVPNKGEMVTMGLTSPYCITIIPKTNSIKIVQ
ncbi:MAG TPA: protease complex subunit PrcB family protein [Flavobacterium sp.]|uniref:protease complex subunit PrcB family protein n=1 Tax=Flavobacterium sp. TaxID=239 RepID=UPI002B4B6A4D|nr:protease complex subunit PrcB family protein [Flavobacterium sp.]HLO72641.1 protease complex subunit PrcB family protein [Flavobacterium sp.]